MSTELVYRNRANLENTLCFGGLLCLLSAVQQLLQKIHFSTAQGLRIGVSPAFLSDSEEMAIISPTEHSFDLDQEQLFLSKKELFSVLLLLFLRNRDAARLP